MDYLRKKAAEAAAALRKNSDVTAAEKMQEQSLASAVVTEAQLQTVSTNPFDGDDAKSEGSSPGASDDGDDEVTGEASSRLEKADAKNAVLKSELAGVVIPEQKAKRSSIFESAAAGFSSALAGIKIKATGEEKQSPAEKKSPLDLEKERLQKLVEADLKREADERAEQARLDAEPQVAKNLRKTFKIIDSVLSLLEGVFQGQRLAESRELLNAELQENAEHAASYECFQVIAPPDSTDIFRKLDVWHAQFEALGSLWQEVFRFNAENSLQPLFKLHFFYQALDGLTKSKIKTEFHAYMVNFNSVISPEQQLTLEIFSETLELFLARATILYQMLNQFNQHIESIAELSGKKNIQFAAAADDDVIDVRDIHDSEISENLIVERDRANLVFDQFMKKVDAITEAMTVFEARLKVIADRGKLNIDEHMAEKLDATEFKADKVLQIFEGEADIEEEDIVRLQETLNSIVNECLAIETQKMDVVRPQLEQARDELTAAAKAVVEAKKEVLIERREAEADREVAAEEMQQGNELVQALKQTALTNTMQFFTEYAARPNSLEKLIFSDRIQASLSDVNPDMLQLWLHDYGRHLNAETLKWIKILITHKSRTLDVAVTISADGIVELALQDSEHQMLGKFYISVNGAPHGTLTKSANNSVSEKIANDYLVVVARRAIQGVSDQKVQITNLLREIRKSKQEYFEHAALPQMSQATIALFGLHVLLSATLPKRGDFRSILVDALQSGPGYDLPACDVVYAEISRQLVEDTEEVTTRASQYTTRASIYASASSSSGSSSNQVTEILEYIFAEYRTEDQLATDKSYPYKKVKLSEQDFNLLTQELQKSRYTHELDTLILIPDMDDVKDADGQEQEARRLQHNVGRKRMKRLAELLNQLPLRNRLELIKYPVIQLMMIREQITEYQRILSSEKSSGLGRFAAKATSFMRKDVPMQIKIAFLQAIFADIYYMYVANQQPTNTNLVRHVLVDVYRQFHAVQVEDTDLMLQGVLKPWFEANIVNKDGVDIVSLMGWLTNSQLEFFLASLGPTFIDDISILRGRNEDGIEEFAKILVENRTSPVQKTEMVDIFSDRQVIILLACQATALTFETQIRATNNVQLIVEASRHNWFLQLRFLEVILEHKAILPEYIEGNDASMNRVRERSMLQVFNQLIVHHSNLADWMREAFGKGRTDIIDMIKTKSNEELEKGAYFLIVLFFNIIFAQESDKAAKSGKSNDARFLLGLARHLGDITRVMGIAVDDENNAVLFGMAVYLLSNHAEELLPNRTIRVLEISEAGSDNVCLVKHPHPKDDLDSEFGSTSSAVQIRKQNGKVPKIFSSDGADLFAASLRFNTRAEEIGIKCAVAYTIGKKG